MQSRRSLAQARRAARQGTHEQVLENPTLLGATSTQVIGNDALNVIAGREDSKRIARDAAAPCRRQRNDRGVSAAGRRRHAGGCAGEAEPRRLRDDWRAATRRERDAHGRRRRARSSAATSAGLGAASASPAAPRRDRPREPGAPHRAIMSSWRKHPRAECRCPATAMPPRPCAACWRRTSALPRAPSTGSRGCRRGRRSASKRRGPQARTSLRALRSTSDGEDVSRLPAGPRFGVAVPACRRARAAHPLAGGAAQAGPVAAVLEVGEILPGPDRGPLRGGLARCAPLLP